ncbi:hypothetical protein TNCV_1642781 [Trichonephila clavipes]|nr:hypothetical protein TNCV_1642781 [Trichonephila clavipes]
MSSSSVVYAVGADFLGLCLAIFISISGFCTFVRFLLFFEFCSNGFGICDVLKCSSLDAGAADFDKETDGSTSVDRVANLLAVVRTGGTSVDNDEAEVFRLLQGEVVVAVGMGIGNEVSLCIVGIIADEEESRCASVDEDDVETVDIEDEVLGIGFAEGTGFRHCKGGQIMFVIFESVWVVEDIVEGSKPEHTFGLTE